MQAPAVRDRNDTQASALSLLRKSANEHGYEDAVKIFWNGIPEEYAGRPPRAVFKATESAISLGKVDNLEGAIERLRGAAIK